MERNNTGQSGRSESVFILCTAGVYGAGFWYRAWIGENAKVDAEGNNAGEERNGNPPVPGCWDICSSIPDDRVSGRDRRIDSRVGRMGAEGPTRRRDAFALPAISG